VIAPTVAYVLLVAFALWVDRKEELRLACAPIAKRGEFLGYVEAPDLVMFASTQ
jgi:hypothetical protein